MNTLDDNFQNLSPLLDNIVAHIGNLRLCPYKAATVYAWAMTRIAIGMRITIADSQIKGEQLSAEERQHLMDMLVDNMRKSDAAIERYGAFIQ